MIELAAMTTNPTDQWFQQFYQPDHAVAATATTVASGPSSVQEGRVSKPARRRARASKKNPTTLLETDTTNFRAMVQRYTGGSTTYSPPGLTRPGSAPIGMHYPSQPAAVDMQYLQQQLLQQYGPIAFSSPPTTAAATRPEAQGVYNLLNHGGTYSSSNNSRDGGRNNTGGFLFD